MQINEQSKLFEKLNNIMKWQVPRNLINEEVSGIYGASLLNEINQIIAYYNIYQYGSEFSPSKSEDFIGADLKFKKVKSLINKQARFMFSNPPTISLSVQQEDEDNNKSFNLSPDDFLDSMGDSDEGNNDVSKQNETELQNFIDVVLKENAFNAKLIKAAKDCFIGKRVALFVNFNEKGIQINFCNSLEFVYETDQETDDITKIICFFMVEDNKEREHQKIYKKKYELVNNQCHITEAIYDGNGELVETIRDNENTLLPFIPAVVIINDGLTGDLLGDSDVSDIYEYESYYSKISNADIDSGRMSMNNIKYLVNVSPETSKGLSIAPGALWDLTLDQTLALNSAPQVGALESSMGYSEGLSKTLDRINNSMYEQLDVPDVSTESLQGIITSGKALKAIYWPLSVRVKEKFIEWGDKIEQVIRMVIEGAKIIPISHQNYIKTIPVIEYDIEVKNNSPIQEDETEEKQMALNEVMNGTLSRKSYLKRYYELNDKEALDEIYQIAMEKRIIEESYSTDVYSEPESNVDNSQNNAVQANTGDETQEATKDKGTEEKGL